MNSDNLRTQITAERHQKTDVPNVDISGIMLMGLPRESFLGIVPSDPQSQLTPELVRHMIQTTYKLQNAVQNMQQDIKAIKNDMRDLLRKLDGKEWEGYGEPEEIVEMSVDEIQKLILDTVGRDKLFYPSDIALEYNLDYNAVLEAVRMLRRKRSITE